MVRFTIKDICFVTALIAAIMAFWLAEQRARRLERLVRSERAMSKTARSEFERVLRENSEFRVNAVKGQRHHDAYFARLREHIDLTDDELLALQTDVFMKLHVQSKSSDEVAEGRFRRTTAEGGPAPGLPANP
jgi:hypothetical protein